ncbi:uncharacterized protein HD556DRAFT_760740 [Suillus plorans]|uniref:Uncharacterized protein n=1 Tax=Suillus plorans TaxID=116603 RepID=A0A9P7DE75_9AGAM|nr:uncharacterized protein HD556DRAFT_760740 [Suillus plorans]KAG1789868.1 hypothetical protein HD556DRAFT_760740 [Suillus plorans]
MIDSLHLGILPFLATIPVFVTQANLEPVEDKRKSMLVDTGQGEQGYCMTFDSNVNCEVCNDSEPNRAWTEMGCFHGDTICDPSLQRATCHVYWGNQPGVEQINDPADAGPKNRKVNNIASLDGRNDA